MKKESSRPADQHPSQSNPPQYGPILSHIDAPGDVILVTHSKFSDFPPLRAQEAVPARMRNASKLTSESTNARIRVRKHERTKDRIQARTIKYCPCASTHGCTNERMHERARIHARARARIKDIESNTLSSVTRARTNERTLLHTQMHARAHKHMRAHTHTHTHLSHGNTRVQPPTHARTDLQTQ